jgi:hypothetical protein
MTGLEDQPLKRRHDGRNRRAQRVGDLEAFGEHEDEGGIDIVDAVAIAAQDFVRHAVSPFIARRTFAADARVGKSWGCAGGSDG